MHTLFVTLIVGILLIPTIMFFKTHKLWWLVLIFVGIVILITDFKFHKQKIRTKTELMIPDEIKNSVIDNTKDLNAFEIAEYCSNVTCSLLKYSINQDKLFAKTPSKAHCVTYARVCSELCNIAYKAHDLDGYAENVCGYYTYFNVNLHKVLIALFPKKYQRYLKDHDVVELNIANKKYYIDPTMHDLFGNFKIKEY